MRKLLSAMALILAAPVATAADDIENLELLAQEQFRGLSEDLGASLSFKPLTPAEAAGVTGFDLGVQLSSTRVENETAWQLATGDDVSTLPMARVMVNKGLPFGFDVGAQYSTIPGSNVEAYGAAVKYSIVEGGVATPAVAVRGALTELTGVDDLSFDTQSVDLSVSKGFGPITPYGGVGRVWVNSEYTGDPLIPGGPTLDAEDFTETKYFAGVRFALTPVRFVFEGDQTGDNTTYSFKFAIGF